LKETEKRRTLQTERRKKDSVKTIALVGYTNTGKSTLMNLLTGADVYVKNELFATLDPTARKFEIEGIEFLLVDTVGFLQDLPHNLIEAFKSTLESAIHCDLALVVCDATGEYDMQMQTTLQTLREMNFQSPYLLVMNKSESISDHSILPYGSIAISAKESVGISALKQAILREFRNDYLFCKLFIPYIQIHVYNVNKQYLIERSATFTDDGQNVDAVIPTYYADKFKEFIVEEKKI
jgi:GTP-binding protein HflX